MHIILAMRRFLTALALSVSILPLSAEKAVWYMPVEPGFTTDAGTFFLPDAFEGLADEIPTGSSVALKNEENDLQAIGDVRDAQMLRLETRLELTREEEAQKTTEELLRTYAKDNMGLKKTSASFEELLDWARNHMESKDIPFFTNWVKNVDNPKVSRKINGKILDLEQHVKQR